MSKTPGSVAPILCYQGLFLSVQHANAEVAFWEIPFGEYLQELVFLCPVSITIGQSSMVAEIEALESHVLALPPMSCVNLGELLNFSVLWSEIRDKDYAL